MVNPAFFGLTANDKPYIYREIFQLCYHGQGGFTFNEVMCMPIWLRRFYIKEINNEIKAENDRMKKQNKKKSSLDHVNENSELRSMYERAKQANKPH